MSDRQRSVRVGTAVILAAIALRLMTTPLPRRAYAALPRPDAAPLAAIYQETGRNVRFLASSDAFSPVFAPESSVSLITSGGGNVDLTLYCSQISSLISSLIIFLCAFVAFFKLYFQASLRKRDEKAAAKPVTGEEGGEG